ncbi:MAG: hypothetical protein WC564_03770 [Patescibacteria group bacterium]|jgi:hypothetical protein
MNTDKTVKDGKLTDEQIGKIWRKAEEIMKRINRGVVSYQDTLDVMQKIIIEGKSQDHLDVIKGSHQIRLIRPVVDTHNTPFIPPGWTIDAHRPFGRYELDVSEIHIHVSIKQYNVLPIDGIELLEELARNIVFNANVLDCLLDHQELIPDDWKRFRLFFWGTIYKLLDGRRVVRCLQWHNDNWNWGYQLIESNFGSHSFAATLAAQH